MTDATVADLTLMPGDSWPPVVWTFKEAGLPMVPAGSTFSLEIQYGYASTWNRTVITEQNGLSVDHEAASVTWMYTPETTRMLAGMCSDYALRCLDADKLQTWVIGRIEVRG